VPITILRRQPEPRIFSFKAAATSRAAIFLCPAKGKRAVAEEKLRASILPEVCRNEITNS
jgi:hypothetical protein